MTPIEAHRIASQQPFHAGNEVRSWSLDDEMKMIAHQTVGMNLPASPRASVAEYFQKALSVHIVAKHCFPPVASIQEMIESAFVFDSDLAGHAVTLRKLALLCQ